ncbi:MAG: serine/threonine-protein kinase [Planctomycetota bacterium]
MSTGADGPESSPLDEFDAGDDAWLERLGSATRPMDLGTLGEYRVLDTLRGGQGLVLRAIQPGTEREVALKRVGSGILASRSELRRFEREVRMLAQLEHPGIVRVYGLDEVEGQPLLVMEWVEGVELDEWARTTGDLRQRVELFLAICDAVVYAHGLGVVHRDLKPSNILVDRQGRPRVLDFGLARSLQTDVDQTLTMGFQGTPAYSPPESFEAEVPTADVRADIWSLGVVLYELLAGRRPFEGSTISALAEDIRHREPPRPGKARPGVDQDLDAIVLQALRKPLVERYASVAELADDLRRWLAGEPVLAHARGTLYLARKWVQRHRTLTAAATLVFLILSTSTVVSARQATLLAAERDRVEQERSQKASALEASERERERAESALAEAEAARALAEARRLELESELDERFLVENFVDVHLVQPLTMGPAGSSEVAREFVRGLPDRIDRFFAERPALAPRQHLRVTHAMMGMGLFDEAAQQARRAADRAEQHEVWHAAGEAEMLIGLILQMRGDIEGFLEGCERAVAAHERGELEDLPLDAALSLSGGLFYAGRLHCNQGDYEPALDLARRSLKLMSEYQVRVETTQPVDGFFAEQSLIAEGLIVDCLLGLERYDEARESVAATGIRDRVRELLAGGVDREMVRAYRGVLLAADRLAIHDELWDLVAQDTDFLLDLTDRPEWAGITDHAWILCDTAVELHQAGHAGHAHQILQRVADLGDASVLAEARERAALLDLELTESDGP